MLPGYPSPFGSAPNMPGGERSLPRYVIGATGVPTLVTPDAVPLQAVPLLRTGDQLEASKTGKHGGPPTATVDPPYTAQALNAVTPQGRGILAEASAARVKELGVRVKLSAKGYVDPRNIAQRTGVGKTDVIGHDLKFIP